MASITFALSVTASFFLPAWFGAHQWLMSSDYWWTVNSAQWVSHLALGTVYQANPFYSALPGFLILLAPVVALGDHLGLAVGLPYPLAYPPMWLLVGPFSFACGSTFLLGVDYLGETLGIPSIRRRIILAVSSPLIGVVTLVIGGHPEDLLALGLACLAFGLLLRGNAGAGAWMLALAVLMQTWAGLLLPTFVMASPVGERIRTAVRATGPPAALGALLLALDSRHAAVDLLQQPMVNAGQHLPWWQMAPVMTITGTYGPPIRAIMGSSSRFGAVIVALAMGLVALRSKNPKAIIAAAALSLTARGVFETEFWPYYLAPAAMLLIVLAGTSPSGKRWLGAFALALELYLVAPAAYIGVSYPPLLALVLLLVTSLSSLAAAGGYEALIAKTTVTHTAQEAVANHPVPDTI